MDFDQRNATAHWSSPTVSDLPECSEVPLRRRTLKDTNGPFTQQTTISTRRLSASFLTNGPLTADPTTAYSSVTVSKPPTINQIPTGSGLKLSATTSYLPVPARRPDPPRKDENKPATAPRVPTPRPQNHNFKQDGISRSRTFSVFSNFTTYLSRKSSSETRSTETARLFAHPAETIPISNRSDNSSSSRIANDNARRTQRPPEIGSCRLIHTSQPSQYWTGRFMALQDRFQNELLLKDNLETVAHSRAELPERGTRPGRKVASESSSYAQSHQLPSNHKVNQSGSSAEHSAGDHLRKSTRLSLSIHNQKAAGEMDAAKDAADMLMDPENRRRRAFLHLEALCVTDEARGSLHAWRHEFSRRCVAHDDPPPSYSSSLRPWNSHGKAGKAGKGNGWVGRFLHLGT